MSVTEKLKRLSGEWQGTNRLWISPDDPARTSSTTARVSFAAHDSFMQIEYGWEFEGEHQDGLLLLGNPKMQETVKAAWIDSWHMGEDLMVCDGIKEDENVISVQGSYPAPPGPDWNWRIIIEPGDGESFKIIMYNISPAGQENLAVEAVYVRQ